jgi:hypothetical protein
MSFDVADQEEPVESGETCPNCGEWPVYFGDETEMECPYCGENFSLPEDVTPTEVRWDEERS